MKLGVTMPILNQPIDAFPSMAESAESAGFDSVWDYEFYRNPFVMHALNCQRTNSIALGTGLATALNRTPFEMANAAADVDEASGGRLLLGLGIGGAHFAEIFHDAETDHPATRMRDYVEVLQRSWHWLDTGEARTYSGRYYNFGVPEFNPFGRRPMARPRIPIYLAGLRPTMLKLAGEVADGAIGFMLPPKYIREVAVPSVAEGARKAGKDPDSVDIASEVICSVSSNRSEAMSLARRQVGAYVAYPVTLPIVQYLGLERERQVVVDGLMKEGPAGIEKYVDDKLVECFAIAGTPDECRAQIKAYEDCLPHILLHTPYCPPITQEESAAAFANIVDTFAR
ncbi:MAG TPA: LLM class flavin-dependent oxidoreductase [Pseudonocardia sp.]|jgi:probable F420-dependent oxidoreductase|nr:LLM class flavin-dependent oxidoreductase [Pseudonocardia sp.]